MIRNDNYIILKGFMVTKLKLSGTKLLLFGIIYGFSQDAVSEYAGGIQYLCEWTGASYKTVCTALQELVEMGLVTKIENAGGTNRYRARFKEQPTLTDSDQKVNEQEQKVKEEEPKSVEENKHTEEAKEIIAYLNTVIGKTTGKNGGYKANTADSAKHINARFNEGYTVSDFKNVIDNQNERWKGTEMYGYMRPATLFGNKFAGYLIKVDKTGKTQERPASYDRDQFFNMQRPIKYERRKT